MVCNCCKRYREKIKELKKENKIYEKAMWSGIYKQQKQYNAIINIEYEINNILLSDKESVKYTIQRIRQIVKNCKKGTKTNE